MLGLDRTFPVDRVPEWVNHTPEQRFAAGDLHHGSGSLDLVTLLEGRELTENHRSDGVFFEVEGKAIGPVRERQHLSCHAI